MIDNTLFYMVRHQIKKLNFMELVVCLTASSYWISPLKRAFCC